MAPKILIINGPNLNLLGTREPDKYGSASLEDLNQGLQVKFPDCDISFYQSNAEHELVNKIQESKDHIDGILINPGAYTHSSIAIRDALLSVAIPAIEIHISDIHSREKFRRISYIKDICICQLSGFGVLGYELGMERILKYLKI